MTPVGARIWTVAAPGRVKCKSQPECPTICEVTKEDQGAYFSPSYCDMELAVAEKALLAFAPINRMVPTTKTRMTANITAYSAIS
jgi:hypothetical protein